MDKWTKFFFSIPSITMVVVPISSLSSQQTTLLCFLSGFLLLYLLLIEHHSTNLLHHLTSSLFALCSAHLHLCFFITSKYQLIGLVGRVFVNGPGDLGSIPGRVIPKTLKKWYLILLCLTLSIIKHISRVKWSNPGKSVAPSSTPWCCSYWKESLWVVLDYNCQLDHF